METDALENFGCGRPIATDAAAIPPVDDIPSSARKLRTSEELAQELAPVDEDVECIGDEEEDELADLFDLDIHPTSLSTKRTPAGKYAAKPHKLLNM